MWQTETWAFHHATGSAQAAINAAAQNQAKQTGVSAFPAFVPLRSHLQALFVAGHQSSSASQCPEGPCLPQLLALIAGALLYLIQACCHEFGLQVFIVSSHHEAFAWCR